MSEESATPESGPLTREQAVELLTERPEPVEQQAPEAPAEAAPEPEQNTEGEASAPEEAEDGAEIPAAEAEAEAEPEAVAPAEPPKYWSQDAKARFAELDPEMQAVVLAQEGPREAATAKAKAEAAEITQRAQAEMAKVAQLADALGEHLPKWVENFQSRWGTQTPDWVAFAQEHGVETMALTKAQFEQEAQQLAEAAQVKQIAETQARQTQVQAEFAKLADIAPDLADPTTGPQKRDEIGQFLVKQGIAPAAVQNISAVEMAIARDAMRWREAQAQLKAAPKPKAATPAPKSAPVRPAAAVPAGNPQQREQQRLQNRFAQTQSREDAVALILAKGL